MTDLPTVASYLFKAAAVLNAASVPGHIAFGWKKLDPVLHTWSKGPPEHQVAYASARGGWDHMTVGILAAAVLNWRWSLTRGPQAADEKIIFWSLFAGGLYVGREFWRVREVKPLLSMWVAPVCSLVGWLMVQ